ncbi:MAG: carbon monoxide dehydrogenase subunit G [Betaproteobacteria bacterium]
MDMRNSVTLPASQSQVWAALNDPQILKQCVPGCESIEATGENAYKVALTVAIGPVRAKFKGNLRLTDIDAPNAYTLNFDGQGGVAGFGKGTARVTLAPEAAGTRLDYLVQAQIGGKIAQLGSRLVDGASKKMADDFFEAFRVALAATMAPATSGPPGAEEVALPTRKPPATLPWWGWVVLAAAAAALWYYLAHN